MPELLNLSMVVNNAPVNITIDPRDTLLDVLRDKLGLTGTKRGCDEGACGACTVILDGKTANSCMVLAATADGADITTIEGLVPTTAGESLHPIQTAFIECGAVQCGFCTPGMILSAFALLKTIHHPSRAQIREALSGNLCRCTGYEKIIDAVEAAAEVMNGAHNAAR